VEAPFPIEQAVGSEDMQVRVKDKVIAEGVDGGSSADATAWQAETRTKGVAQSLGGGLEKEMEEVAALAEEKGTNSNSRSIID
jgi:hypothetical protein